MADYTEKATLLLVDKSSKPIDNINKSLLRLQKTATQVQKALSAMGKIDGSNSAVKSLNNLTSAINKTASAAKKLTSVKLNVKMTGASASQLNAMARAAQNYKTSTKGIKTIIGAGGGKGSDYKNLDLLTQKMVGVARASNMANVAIGKIVSNLGKINPQTLRGLGNLGNPNHPINNPPMPPRRGGGGGLGGGGNFWSLRPQGPHLIGFDLQPLQTVLRHFIVDLAREIARGVREGFAEGTKGFDVANNKMLQQQLPADVRNDFRSHAFAASKVNPLFRPDERMDLYAEIATNYKNPRDALKFDAVLDRLLSISFQQGQDRGTAIEGIQQLFRGLGQAGLLQTNTGEFNSQVFDYINAISAAKISEGKQIDWNNVFQFFKQAKTSGQSLSPRELFFNMINAADVGGASGGTQFNMAVTNFTDSMTKKALKAQEDAGLREPGQKVLTGYGGRGGKTPIYSYEAGPLKEQDMFREDYHAWIAKYILGKGGYLDKMGIDLATAQPSTVISALNRLNSNRNSKDFLSKAVLQYQEDLIKAGKFYGPNAISDEGLKAISDQSVWVNYQATIQQTTTLLGLLGDKLSNLINGPLEFVRSIEQSLIDMIEGKSKNQIQDSAFLAGAGALGIGAGVAGVKLLQWLSGALGLNAAATALTTSAGALMRAALMLSGSATAQNMPGGLPGGKNGGGWWAAAAAWATRLTTLGAIATTMTGDTPRDAASTNRQLEYSKRNSREFYNDKIQTLSTKISYIDQQLNDIQARRAANVAAGRPADFGFSVDPTMQGNRLKDDKATLTDQIAQAQASLLATFDEGWGKSAQASQQFGDNAAAALINAGSAFGASAAEAIRAALAQINVNVQQQIPAAAPAPVNTGTNTNLATGG